MRLFLSGRMLIVPKLKPGKNAIRPIWSRLHSLVGLLLLNCWGTALGTNQAADVIRVEEDWEMVITDPDVVNYSPQVNLFFSPNGSRLDQYFQVQLNHALHDDFTGGGLRVAAIVGDTSYHQARGQVYAPLAQFKESVKWTTVVAIKNGEFLFAVKNGFCPSWGSFGGPDFLVRMPAEGTTSLNQYDPQVSLDLIDIGFGKNRVELLQLKRVRCFRTDGHIETVEVNQGYSATF